MAISKAAWKLALSIGLAAGSAAGAGEGVALIVPDFHRFAIDGNLDGRFDWLEQWGLPGDQIMIGEPYGAYRDGRSDLVVMRNRRDWGEGWYVKSQDGARSFSGRYVRKPWATLDPLYGAGRGFLADFNGDGRDEAVAFLALSGPRPSQTIYVDRDADMVWTRYVDSGVAWSGSWLAARDRLLAGRMGAPTDEMLVWRDATGNWEFYVTDRGSPTALRFQVVQFGLAGDIPLVTDANGDGLDDLAVFRPGNNTLYINHYERGATQAGYGPGGDVDRTVDYGPAIRAANTAHGLALSRRWDLGAAGIRW